MWNVELVVGAHTLEDWEQVKTLAVTLRSC